MGKIKLHAGRDRMTPGGRSPAYPPGSPTTLGRTAGVVGLLAYVIATRGRDGVVKPQGKRI
ncbi:MAG: hypothetical protein GYA17_15520 [Chloroflexi bacterium]|nr:hypothetical protein [Anaerolineaceae bacterium]NMB89768.1 hypothetical protein [Chloroflexota bacterium]